MRPWTVDADDISIAEDFDDALLHKTSWIEDFLSAGHDNKFIVIGTKGFGKTLLLKAKRIRFQKSGNIPCIPENALLDKPVGDKVFSKDMLALYAHSTEWWSKLWLIAIACAVLKRLDLHRNLRVDARLGALLEDDGLAGVIDHFVNLIDLPRPELHRCATDTDNVLVPRLRALRTPVAAFIDNVDEYFNKHVRTGARSSATGEVSPNVWYFSQMGLVEVAYQLRRVNHHIKVFAAIRKEAFSKFSDMTSMVQQYRGSAIDIAYSVAGLREIFVNNIRREKDRNLVCPERLKANPIEAFVGRTSVLHPYTYEEEDVFEYIVRHTLLRPRDLMTIGQKLSDLRPDERRRLDRFQQIVNQGANEIASEYLIEIAPYLGGVNLHEVLARLGTNVLTLEQVEEIFLEHNAAAGSHELWTHIFCILYRSGLLGFLERDHVSGKRLQRFLPIGERIFDTDGALPVSTHYLVHPILGGLVSRLNPEFAGRLERVNIIGPGRMWREPSDHQLKSLLVLRADVAGFGSLMQQGVDAEVRDVLQRAVTTFAGDCLHASYSQGDSVTLVDDRVRVLVKAARRMMEEVAEAQGSPRLRVAIAAGPVQVREHENAPLSVEGGRAVLMASRIEPYVTPGQIWITDEVRLLLETTQHLFRTERVVIDVSEHLRRGDEVNVKKPGSDEGDIWVKLYRVVAD